VRTWLVVVAAGLTLLAVPACEGTSHSSASGSTGSSSSSSSSGAFVPAAHPPAPVVENLGGLVLAAPKVLPILYAWDSDLADIQAFLEEMTKTTYWGETTSEYGVGPLTMRSAVVLQADVPATQADLEALISANTTGAEPAWGEVDPSTIYLFVLPECKTFQGADGFSGPSYHYETTVGAVSVAFAVSCPNTVDDLTELQARTAGISHELIESATDPLEASNPAFHQEDPDDVFWTEATGGEVADMCEDVKGAFIVPDGGTYTVQRSWSNAASKARKNPCVPPPANSLAFGASPARETVTWMLAGMPTPTQGIVLPVGETRTIDVTMWSSAPMPGPWTVTPYDYSEFVGDGLPNLELTLDADTGKNGDVLKLTVKSVSTNVLIGGSAGLLLFSDYGKPGDADFVETMTAVVVVPQ
jgi:hypothetical protein